jgi:3-hydroxyacyl-[acyl-carrier-protein] dehydratase
MPGSALDRPVEDMRIDQFQLVSLVETLDIQAPTISVRARTPQNHTIFEGHFPGHPLMPGVLLTEMMAQTCGFLLLALNGFAKMPFLAALKDVKLRDFVRPGTELLCQAAREHDGSGYAVMKASVRRPGDENRVCDGTLTFRIVPYPNDQLRQHMLERAREVGLAVAGAGVCVAEQRAAR